MQYLLAGFSDGVVPVLQRLLPESSVTVIEDPYLIDSRGVAEKVARFSCIDQLVPAPLQDEIHPERILAAIETKIHHDVIAVIPGHEYGVVAAAAIAERLALPGAGLAAALILRDKAKLRRAAAQAGLAQPVWREVSGVEDITSFPNTPMVIKPTTYEGSVGVRLTEPGDDKNELRAAWQSCLASRDPMHDPSAAPPRWLVESRLQGREISTELLVRDGQIVFTNQTAKTTLPGQNPVEVEHVVPAPEQSEINEELADLVSAIGFQDGVLHAEWIFVGGTPHLIECAGRMPGDDIASLVDLVYGGSMTGDLVAILSGHATNSRRPARGGAAVKFLLAHPGTVEEIVGLDEARRVRGILDISVTCKPGDIVRPARSSWDRLGRALGIGSSASDALLAVRMAADAVRVRTRADPALEQG